MKRVSILGNGTAGMISALSFLDESFELELYYDPNINPQSVGEGTTLWVARHLHEQIAFNHSDLGFVDGTFKYGIKKPNWGPKEFTHHFPPPGVAYHFNARKLQQFILDRIRGKVKIFEGNYTHEDIDSDCIIDCSGTPNSFEEFEKTTGIPVNAVHVTQCYWNYPTFQYTLALARPYGWVFFIPLQNRCSVGYLYNHDINNLDEIKSDCDIIFDEYKLTPSETVNSFKFNNYYRKNNFQGRVCYNGNASFFLEPMEATSIVFMAWIADIAKSKLLNNIDEYNSNERYKNLIKSVENVISIHYLNNTNFDTKFWNYAKNISNETIDNSLKTNLEFKNVIVNVLSNLNNNIEQVPSWGYGTWGFKSFRENIKGLGIENTLRDKLYNLGL